MFLVLWIVLGIVSGLIVSIIVSGQQNAWQLNIMLGVLGAVVAGKLSVLTDPVQIISPGRESLFVAVAGAILTVVAYRAFTRRRPAR